MKNNTPVGKLVLVVENNTLLKLFMGDLVKTAGFDSIQASDADEAMTFLENRSDIALLITNIVMQGSMTGTELAHAVDTSWPSVKIIVVSGQTELLEKDFPRKCLLFRKPYHDEELIFDIRSQMGADAGRVDAPFTGA